MYEEPVRPRTIWILFQGFEVLLKFLGPENQVKPGRRQVLSLGYLNLKFLASLSRHVLLLRLCLFRAHDFVVGVGPVQMQIDKMEDGERRFLCSC